MIVTISKITVFGVEYWFAEEFINLSIFLLAGFHGHAKLELLFVMMIVPFTLNCVQYWAQDNFLKGTDFIESQKKINSANKRDMKQLYVMQDGMIDFQKNRAQYRAAMGLDE